MFTCRHMLDCRKHCGESASGCRRNIRAKKYGREVKTSRLVIDRPHAVHYDTETIINKYLLQILLFRVVEVHRT